MQKLARASLSYMIIGLISGVYFREFTKLKDFTDWTQLSVVHTHTLILGMFFFLIVLLFDLWSKMSFHFLYTHMYLYLHIVQCK